MYIIIKKNRNIRPIQRDRNAAHREIYKYYEERTIEMERERERGIHRQI